MANNRMWLVCGKCDKPSPIIAKHSLNAYWCPLGNELGKALDEFFEKHLYCDGDGKDAPDKPTYDHFKLEYECEPY